MTPVTPPPSQLLPPVAAIYASKPPLDELFCFLNGLKCICFGVWWNFFQNPAAGRRWEKKRKNRHPRSGLELEEPGKSGVASRLWGVVSAPPAAFCPLPCWSTTGSPAQRCREFLLRCFKKDPTQRPSARALIKDPWLAPFYSHRKGAHTHMCEGGGNGAYTHVRTCADTQPRTQPYAHTATPNTFQNAKKHQHTLHTLALNRICIMFGT